MPRAIRPGTGMDRTQITRSAAGRAISKWLQISPANGPYPNMATMSCQPTTRTATALTIHFWVVVLAL
ncbi:hypothetical protein D3C72_2325460 [compost metagenome]